MTRSAVWVCALGCLALGSVATGSPESPSYGVDSVSTYVVTAWDMEPAGPAISWSGAVTPNLHRYATTGGGFLAGAHLPQGASILSLELEACDTSASGSVTAVLYRAVEQGAATPLAIVDTGTAATF